MVVGCAADAHPLSAQHRHVMYIVTLLQPATPRSRAILRRQAQGDIPAADVCGAHARAQPRCRKYPPATANTTLRSTTHWRRASASPACACARTCARHGGSDMGARARLHNVRAACMHARARLRPPTTHPPCRWQRVALQPRACRIAAPRPCRRRAASPRRPPRQIASRPPHAASTRACRCSFWPASHTACAAPRAHAAHSCAASPAVRLARHRCMVCVRV